MLPASLVTIGKSAFLNCRALDYVDTGNAETITEYAFEGCSNLREVILSEKLETVGNCAFRNCVSLSLIDIPGSVETLGVGCSRTAETCRVLSCMKVYNPCLKALSTDAASVLSASPLP